MASNLFWRPVEHGGPAPGEDPLKLRIRDRYGLSSRREPILLVASECAFLEGLAAAGVEGAKGLVDLVKKHREIEVWEEH